MKFNLLTIAAATLSSLPASFAADCGRSQTCIGPGASTASRQTLYENRDWVCNNIWQGSGRRFHKIQNSCLVIDGATTQQTCWDAFENIINQCQKNTFSFTGDYKYNGASFYASWCTIASNSACK